MQPRNRRERIVQWILAVIQSCEEAKKAINLEHLVAECCMQFFCGERLVRECLKHLKLTNKIYEEYDELFIVRLENKAASVRSTGNPVLDLPVNDKNTRGGL
jgi:hypothetical protein